MESRSAGRGSRSRTASARTVRDVLLLAAILGFASSCDAGSETPRPVPFTGEQLDRIDAGLRNRALDEGRSAGGEAVPLWIATELLDGGTRLVVHVRLALQGDLDEVATNQERCRRAREAMQAYLLPGQEVEMYLVFDGSIHACRSEPTTG